MMIGRLGNLGDLLHELNAVQEFLELERLADCVVLVFPPGQRFQLLRNLFGTEFGHVEILRKPSKSEIISACPSHHSRLRACAVIPVARGCGNTQAPGHRGNKRWRTNTLPTKLASKSARLPNRGLTKSSAAQFAA